MEGPRIVGPADGKTVDFGSFGVRFMVRGEESGGGLRSAPGDWGGPVLPDASVQEGTSGTRRLRGP
ncbi:MAG TPA: hypothetical protein VKA73_06875 [Rubrobacter sp.]|nr:hypothetical protein [Rubrobacter sp.]